MEAKKYAGDIVVALGLAKIANDSQENVIAEALELYHQSKMPSELEILALAKEIEEDTYRTHIGGAPFRRSTTVLVIEQLIRNRLKK